MPTQCPVCARINPTGAQYCYYDGGALSGALTKGPVHVGSVPFATSFHFADGQACANFNELAFACDDRWEETRSLLAEGVWPLVFTGLGRLDLAAAAKLAAKELDADRGLSQLLEKMPADPRFLRPPKLAVQSAEEDLGQLAPGADRIFELVIINQGMRLLHGTVVSTCEWLVFGDRAGPSQRLFQTRNFCTIMVRVLGGKLRAGRQPLQGDIVIDSNGGTLTVPVRVAIPIRPFPQGTYANDALAGAMSPREIAVRARENPSAAASLFEQGAVKDWYVSNGWTYPIAGAAGSGRGAVQQFLEALGLTKPPHLEIDTDSLTLMGSVGERLSRSVTLGTAETKPVYAQVWSNQAWVSLDSITYLRNKVRITVQITVPPRPGEIVHAEVTIRGNGNQQFVVPVGVAVTAADPHAASSAGWGPVAEAPATSVAAETGLATEEEERKLPKKVLKGITSILRTFLGQK